MGSGFPRATETVDHLLTLYPAPEGVDARPSVPDFVADAIRPAVAGPTPWRGDHCRLSYLLHALPLEQIMTVTEIGARNGFFSLSLAHAFPHLAVTACEADPGRAKFMRGIGGAFALQNLTVIPKSVTLRSLDGLGRQDLVLLLNVLHHAGCQFDHTLPRTRAAFTEYATDYLARLAARRDYLFFQMSAHWGGHQGVPLVPGGTRIDQLRYMASLLVNAGWEICRVAYPARADGVIVYRDLPEMVTGTLNDDPEGVFDEVINAGLHGFDVAPCPGEFSSRPLFTCASTRPQHQPA